MGWNGPLDSQPGKGGVDYTQTRPQGRERVIWWPMRHPMPSHLVGTMLVVVARDWEDGPRELVVSIGKGRALDLR